MIRLPIRPLTLAASTLALVTATTTILTTPASAGEPNAAADKADTSADMTPMHWSCGRGAPQNLDDRPGYVTEAANVRSGSSTRCSDLYTIYPGEKLDMFCWARDINGIHTWTYVISVPYKDKRGWIRDDLLQGNGSNKVCPGQTPPTAYR
ncbi:SH3 domain-containing protein [Micromonospora sp. NPDC051227]|uniref:SH3 domain-containing protein n=1 Tax=Micromonospora sp. NPDC051227 TaxID=3364285 RepID=UPI0037BD43ED